MIDARLVEFLERHGIPFQSFEHPAVYTCEQARELKPPIPGTATKNLFLRDGKGRRHFLVAVPDEKSLDLKALSQLLAAPGLGFASPDRLERWLKLTPGAVTLLAALNDETRQVEIIIDEHLWQSEKLCCHGLTNTSTVLISREDLSRFLELTGHPPRIMQLPGKDHSSGTATPPRTI